MKKLGPRMATVALAGVLAGVLAGLCGPWGARVRAEDPPTPSARPAVAGAGEDAPSDSDGRPDRVLKTRAEWARILTPLQYQVTRRKQTEPAYTGEYWNSHKPGVYRCVCCAEPLFDSTSKFDSGTGWPSFWRPIAAQSLETKRDNSTAERRVEVICRRCNAHLGHVFADGPPPTGLRFCINSAAIKLEERAEPAKSR